ncbi:MAG: endonuclease/exonuclease/phosphatase family protein [Magnetospiraceae bacterium]
MAHLRIATYNIHAGIGADGQFDPERIARVLSALNADVIALQEVEHHPHGDGHLLDFLATETRMTALDGATLTRQDRPYGNALLTRLPVHGVERIDLSLTGREPRGALDVLLNANGQTVRCIATHLGLSPQERRMQTDRLLSRLAHSPADMEILAGDFNEWFLWGRVLRRLNRHFRPTPALRTFPARWPLFALDRIWVHPRDALKSSAVFRSAEARIASDHLPLIGSLILDRGAREPGPKPAKGDGPKPTSLLVACLADKS